MIRTKGRPDGTSDAYGEQQRARVSPCGAGNAQDQGRLLSPAADVATLHLDAVTGVVAGRIDLVAEPGTARQSGGVDEGLFGTVDRAVYGGESVETRSTSASSFWPRG